MTISLKRRRELIKEANEYAQAFRYAVAYGKAGDTETAKVLLDAVKFSELSPEDSEWLKSQTQKWISNVLRKYREREMQGLPAEPEHKKPTLQ
jgi:hypothetical protein